MNRHFIAALFLVGCLLLAGPVLLMQSSGVANASLTTGFMFPIENKLHCLCLLVIGGLAAWLAREMLVLLPICALLMLLLGTLAHVENTVFPEVMGFTVGAILLFSLSVSMMRHRISLVSVAPIAAWTYFTGNSYMAALPESIEPLNFMVGIVISAALLIAIGVALAMTTMEVIKVSLNKLKAVAVIVSFFAIF